MSDQWWQVSADEEGQRLDKWLAAEARLGSRSRALEAIQRGKVFLDDAEQTVADAGRRLRSGERVRLWMDRPGTARRHVLTDRHVSGLHLIYEDDSLLVVNKPAGLLTVSLAKRPLEASLADLVATYLRPRGKLRPLLVHRIDRDTSGLVLFAKTPQAQAKLKDQFAGHVAERIYRAIVYGCPKPVSGTWRDHLVWDRDYLIQRQARPGDPRAKEAVSHYRVLEKYANAALVEVRLVTGKRNQIRIQAGLRGHQLVGERKYVFEPAPRRMIEFPRQALHAHRLGFHHPTDDRALSFEAPLPEDFVSLISKLKG